MDYKLAKETLNQLMIYTRSVSKLHGIKFEQTGKNHNGPFKDGCPMGAITHYTASNKAQSKRRPYGRLPVLLHRFARGAVQKVGVHFIVWDEPIERHRDIRNRLDLLRDMPGEVLHYGDDLAFWHGGWTNDYCYGVEVRNVGKLIKKGGVYFWGRKSNRYRGNPPVKVGPSYWEPYTRSQMAALLWVHRLMASVHRIKPEWFLGHTHVTSNRIDPGPHFPIHEMRDYALKRELRDIPLSEVPFLQEFKDYDLGEPEDEEFDPLVSEHSLQEGLYRNDWDGDVGEFEKVNPIEPEPEYQGKTGEIKAKLRSLGYYPGSENNETIDQAYRTTVRIFRSRWKKRSRPGGRFVQEIPINEQMDQVAQQKLDQMIRMWDNL